MGKYAEQVIAEHELKKDEKLTDEEKNALRDYFNSFENEIMYCPNCQHTLAVGDWFTYDDVCGESHSPKYTCPNKLCDCHNYNAFWNSYGEFFSGDLKWNHTTLLFPDDKYAALNSISKESEIEIYGKGLKRKIYLHAAFCLWILKPYIEFKYKGDRMGNVLNRTWKLKFLKWDKHQKNYCTCYTSGLHMLIWCFKRFKRERKAFIKCKTLYSCNQVIDNFKARSWDKRWWYKFTHWYFNYFFKNLKVRAEKMKSKWDLISYEELEFLAKESNKKIEDMIDYIETCTVEDIKELKESCFRIKQINE